MGSSCLTFREEPLARVCVSKAEPSLHTIPEERSRDPALFGLGRGSRLANDMQRLCRERDQRCTRYPVQQR
jgi:hypothetical protein